MSHLSGSYQNQVRLISGLTGQIQEVCALYVPRPGLGGLRPPSAMRVYSPTSVLSHTLLFEIIFT